MAKKKGKKQKKKKHCSGNNTSGAVGGDSEGDVNINKKIILDNFQNIKNSYKPRLINTKNIGIFCSSRRIMGNKLEGTLYSLVKHLPENSALKLHPSMYQNNSYIKKILILLEKFNRTDIFVWDSETIIEAEMLFEKKKLIGPLTSLIKYAEIFGSSFKQINIYWLSTFIKNRNNYLNSKVLLP